MNHENIAAKRWNIFARELEQVVATRGLRLTQLDDHKEIYLHSQKVKRLVDSLSVPKVFPVLTPDEMERLAIALQLSEYEQLRLRAAILATAIERMLAKRLNEDVALIAAEQVFPPIIVAMQKHMHEISGLGAVKAEESSQLEELPLEDVLDDIESATVALHLSFADTQNERVRYARQARDSFELALAKLGEIDEEIQVENEWQVWYEAIKKGLFSSNERIETLGEE